MACGEVGTQDDDAKASIWPELEHLYRVAIVEVEEFVGRERVHFAEGAGFEEVVDCGAHRSLPRSSSTLRCDVYVRRK